MANISAIKLPDGVTYNIKDNSSGYITGMTILSYGSSTWDDFITAYNANKVVYCRASSNSNPASGSQTRLAFMAYVNNATTPTNVEFQYYRSVSSHTASQQGDQVYVYKLDKTSGWSVTTREASVKVVAGTGLGGTYSNGTMTLTGPTKVSDLTNDSGFITGYTETDPVFSASAAAGITSSDITNWNSKQAALVSGTNIKTINNTSLLGSGNIDTKDVFVAEYGVTTYAEVLEAYEDSQSIICERDGLISPLSVYDELNNMFMFVSVVGFNEYQIFLTLTDGWNSVTETLAATSIATTSANGLMSSTDKSKLDGIASGAEKNVITAIHGSDDLHAYIMPYLRFTKANGGYEYATTYVGVNNLIDARGFITTETDPTVPSWAKQSTKPTYTASEVGALPDTTQIPSKTSDLTNDSGFTTKNIWYATCSTTSSTQAKVATTDSQDFVLAKGNMVRIRFMSSSGNSYNGTATLDVDGTGAKTIYAGTGDSATRYLWQGGEIVDFIYSGSYFYMSNKSTATTTYYGLTKLSSSTSSTSIDVAATSSAVKKAYDLAADATETPTADTKSKFDSNAHMNSTDMTEQDITDFVNSLNFSGAGMLNFERASEQLANSNVMTWTAGSAHCIKIDDGLQPHYLVFFAYGINTTQQRIDLAAFRIIAPNNHVLYPLNPYFFPCTVNGEWRFAFGNYGDGWITAPGQWNANTGMRISGVGVFYDTGVSV